MRSTHFLIAALTLSFSPLPSICETPRKAQPCYIAVLSDVLSWDRGAGAALSHAHTGAGCSILTHKPQPRVPSSVAPRPLRQAVQAPTPARGAHVMHVRRAEAPPQVASFGGECFFDCDCLEI